MNPLTASDEHLIGALLGVGKARAVAALPDAQKFGPGRSMKCKARHGDRQLNVRGPGLGHMKTDEEEQRQ